MDGTFYLSTADQIRVLNSSLTLLKTVFSDGEKKDTCGERVSRSYVPFIIAQPVLLVDVRVLINPQIRMIFNYTCGVLRPCMRLGTGKPRSRSETRSKNQEKEPENIPGANEKSGKKSTRAQER